MQALQILLHVKLFFFLSGHRIKFTSHPGLQKKNNKNSAVDPTSSRSNITDTVNGIDNEKTENDIAADCDNSGRKDSEGDVRQNDNEKASENQVHTCDDSFERRTDLNNGGSVQKEAFVNL